MKKREESLLEKSLTVARRRTNRNLRRVTESTAEKLVRFAKHRQNEKLRRSSEIDMKRCDRLPHKSLYMKSERAHTKSIQSSFRLWHLSQDEQQETLINRLTERATGVAKKQKGQAMKTTQCKIRAVKYHCQMASDNDTCGSYELSLNAIQRELKTLHGFLLSESNSASISSFLNNINEGLYYMCTCCNRMLYQTSVRKFDASLSVSTDVTSFDDVEYICNTCLSNK